MTAPRSCVGKDGRFIVGIHKPCFEIKNLREHDYITSLGQLQDGKMVDNKVNFPGGDLYEPDADTIYEIANPFPFRGTTYINSAWADKKAAHPETISIPAPGPCSLLKNFELSSKTGAIGIQDKKSLLDLLPHPLLIALAQASTDPEELVLLAKKSCKILFDPKTGAPDGIGYRKNRKNKIIPDIHDHELFEVLVNNRHLPGDYKNTLVLKPGVQGNNEITGEYISQDKNTHVFEYLRRNSYIPWGHFASNMANDAIRYRALDLCHEDMKGIRHLYYQRTFARLAKGFGILLPEKRRCLKENELESIRKKILAELEKDTSPSLEFGHTLWGWNFGYGYAQSGHRLHASHQMIHHQNAMIPKNVKTDTGEILPSFACGDLVKDFILQYRKATSKNFFLNYLAAIKNNTRTDKKPGYESSLILLEDDHTILFVPKAQISEWELQLMPKTPCGNILEADTSMRRSLDKAILSAVKTLEFLGAQMVTSIEFSKQFDCQNRDHHLLYSFIPRLPYAPDTFSEAQLRWISGCYPEDFAHACRTALKTISGQEFKKNDSS
ncbi:MAG: hypothetical protein GXP56_03610 [Deltaproteobacteria bacterium]|nr:hypothetical protein [Deltaproteobacteria bacterium]